MKNDPRIGCRRAQGEFNPQARVQADTSSLNEIFDRALFEHDLCTGNTLIVTLLAIDALQPRMKQRTRAGENPGAQPSARPAGQTQHRKGAYELLNRPDDAGKQGYRNDPYPRFPVPVPEPKPDYAGYASLRAL